jgi:hypothetical protein
VEVSNQGEQGEEGDSNQEAALCAGQELQCEVVELPGQLGELVEVLEEVSEAKLEGQASDRSRQEPTLHCAPPWSQR